MLRRIIDVVLRGALAFVLCVLLKRGLDRLLPDDDPSVTPPALFLGLGAALFVVAWALAARRARLLARR